MRKLPTRSSGAITIAHWIGGGKRDRLYTDRFNGDTIFPRWLMTRELLDPRVRDQQSGWVRVFPSACPFDADGYPETRKDP